jgi:hypothetical protein
LRRPDLLEYQVSNSDGSPPSRSVFDQSEKCDERPPATQLRFSGTVQAGGEPDTTVCRIWPAGSHSAQRPVPPERSARCEGPVSFADQRRSDLLPNRIKLAGSAFHRPQRHERQFKHRCSSRSPATKRLVAPTRVRGKLRGLATVAGRPEQSAHPENDRGREARNRRRQSPDAGLFTTLAPPAFVRTSLGPYIRLIQPKTQKLHGYPSRSAHSPARHEPPAT